MTNVEVRKKPSKFFVNWPIQSLLLSCGQGEANSKEVLAIMEED
jgi:hypothetical protein